MTLLPKSSVAVSLILASLMTSASSCPMMGRRRLTGEEELPEGHPHIRGSSSSGSSSDDTGVRGRGRVLSPADRERVEAVVRNAIERHETDKANKNNRRFLQNNETIDGCVTTSTYDTLMTDIEAIGEAIIDDDSFKGHFYGAIVRLVAHDFMDYDGADATPGGSDGCITFTDGENVGLSDVWCDTAIPDDPLCPFPQVKTLFDTVYGPAGGGMSRADFWVAIGNAAIKATSIGGMGGLDLPFRWGRTDRAACPESSGRLPSASGCSEVERVMLTNMGLTWTDAVALMGAHTLGRGLDSGHVGNWVANNAGTTRFDKQYYNELINRPWIPRIQGTAPDDVQNWQWGRDDRDPPVLGLNTDICLYFDIPEGPGGVPLDECCTNIAQNCRGVSTQCTVATSARADAVAAVDAFRAGANNDNAAFYAAFASAWEKATENGLGSGLNDLNDTGCLVDPPPPCTENQNPCNDSAECCSGFCAGGGQCRRPPPPPTQ